MTDKKKSKKVYKKKPPKKAISGMAKILPDLVNPYIFEFQEKAERIAQYKIFLEWANSPDYPETSKAFSDRIGIKLSSINKIRPMQKWDTRAAARDQALQVLEANALRKKQEQRAILNAEMKARALNSLASHVEDIMQVYISMTVPDEDGEFVRCDAARVTAIKHQLALLGIQPEDVHTLIVKARPTPMLHADMSDEDLDRQIEFYEEALDGKDAY